MISIVVLAAILLVLVFIGPRFFGLTNIRKILCIMVASYFFGQIWIYLWAALFRFPFPLLVLMCLAGLALVLRLVNMGRGDLEEDTRALQMISTYGYIFGPAWIYLWARIAAEPTYSSAISASLGGACVISFLMLMFSDWSMKNVHKPLEMSFALKIQYMASGIITMILGVLAAI